MASTSDRQEDVTQGREAATAGQQASTEHHATSALLNLDPDPPPGENKALVVIAFEISRAANDDETVNEVRSILRTKSNTEDMTIAKIANGHVVGNTRGLSLAEEGAKRAFTTRIVRERYICEFKKREMPEDFTGEDGNRIRDGNIVVHEGNIVEDVKLYGKTNPRPDTAVFKKLYGIFPSEFGHIADHTNTRKILDIHATCIASRFIQCPKAFHNTFERFTAELESMGYPRDCVCDPTSAIGKAYIQFKKVAKPVLREHEKIANGRSVARARHTSWP
ncbi:hypothetical protein BBP40_002953 [Aspergillus hancockii]|nr:hypothetical protein BBP40_002953 [Aspergillus hancockii]